MALDQAGTEIRKLWGVLCKRIGEIVIPVTVEDITAEMKGGFSDVSIKDGISTLMKGSLMYINIRSPKPEECAGFKHYRIQTARFRRCIKSRVSAFYVNNQLAETRRETGNCVQSPTRLRSQPGVYAGINSLFAPASIRRATNHQPGTYHRNLLL